MSEPVYIHLDLSLYPDIKIDPDMPLGGEGFWCSPQDDGTFVVDNLLSTTLEVGYGDRIRCADQGTEWGAREFAEVVEHLPCYRAVVAPPEHIDPQHHSQFVHELNEYVTRNYSSAKTEGGAGIGLLCVQVSEEEGPRFMDWLANSEYPHMAEGWESIERVARGN